MAQTDDQLGEALGKAFVEEAFGPAAKADMLKMVQGIKAAMKGADVVVNYVSGDEVAQQVVEDITQGGVQAYAHQADVSKEDQVQAMFQRMRGHNGMHGGVRGGGGASGFMPQPAMPIAPQGNGNGNSKLSALAKRFDKEIRAFADEALGQS